MSEAAAHGIGHPIEWQGKTWTLGPFTRALTAHYEQWLKGQAWREVEEDRDLMAQGLLAPHIYEARHKAVSELIAGKEHRRGGKVYNASWGTDEALTRRLYLMVWQNHQDFTPDQAALMLEEIPEIVMSRYVDLMRLPNSKGETTKQE